MKVHNISVLVRFFLAVFLHSAGVNAASNERPFQAPERFPFSAALWNLSGQDMNALIAEDAAAFKPLFKNIVIHPAETVPQAMVVFAYSGLNDAGMLAKYPKYDVRELAQLSHAKLFIMAAPSSADSVKAAAGRKGPKVNTVVYTLNRHGAGFTRFFSELFDDMRTGTPILSAWVKIAPQSPDAMPSYVPDTIVLAEGGNWALPMQVVEGRMARVARELRWHRSDAIAHRFACRRPR